MNFTNIYRQKTSSKITGKSRWTKGQELSKNQNKIVSWFRISAFAEAIAKNEQVEQEQVEIMKRKADDRYQKI